MHSVPRAWPRPRPWRFWIAAWKRWWPRFTRSAWTIAPRSSSSPITGSKRTPRRFGRPRNPVLQRQPVQKLHGKKQMSIFLPNLMDRANIGMVERRSSTGLAAETLQCLGILREIVREKLEGGKSTKRDVLGLVNRSEEHTS